MTTDILRQKTKVLVTDDDRVQRLILRQSLEADGYEVYEAENGAEALEILYKDSDIRLLLTDLAMPKMDGYELIQIIRQGSLRYTYIIVLTGLDDRDSLLKALSLGADDYLTKPVFPDELTLRLKSGLRLLKLESHEALIFSMAKLTEYRSEETGFHLERVTYYTRLLARYLLEHHPELKLTYTMADEIGRVSPLHDIGKIAIADNILHKPGSLTTEEFEIMKTHTTIGGMVLRSIYDTTSSPYLWLGYEIAMFHHERWDGGGYPQGLSGEGIPISARIMAIADVYDALTSKRCYKDAISHETAKAMIIEQRGKHFDPKIVDAFVNLEERWIEIKRRFQD